MRFAVIIALAATLLVLGCSAGDSDGDGAADAGRDYPRIEGPITKPVVDLPVHPDQTAPDTGASDGGGD